MYHGGSSVARARGSGATAPPQRAQGRWVRGNTILGYGPPDAPGVERHRLAQRSVYHSVGHNAQEEHTMLALYLRIRNLFVREDGQDLIEYALLVAFIALVAVIGVTTAGESIMDLFNNVAGELDGFVTP